MAQLTIKQIEENLNDNFPALIDAKFKEYFGTELITNFDLQGRLHSFKPDFEKFTEVERAWVNAFRDGHSHCLLLIRENCDV